MFFEFIDLDPEESEEALTEVQKNFKRKRDFDDEDEESASEIPSPKRRKYDEPVLSPMSVSSSEEAENYHSGLL